MQLRSLLATAVLLSAGLAAHADSIFNCSSGCSVTVTEGVQNGNAFSATNAPPTFASSNGTATATFTYTGLLSFSNTAAQNNPGASPMGDLNSIFFNTGNISNYLGTGTVTYGSQTVANYNNQTAFLASSGSASGFAYGSYYTFNLGTQSKGTTFTVTHDDGASIYTNGQVQGNLTSGATSAVTESATLNQAGGTVLYYGRENGTPSVLTVTTSATPEPSSLALLGTGLLGIAGVVRKRLAA